MTKTYSDGRSVYNPEAQEELSVHTGTFAPPTIKSRRLFGTALVGLFTKTPPNWMENPSTTVRTIWNTGATILVGTAAVATPFLVDEHNGVFSSAYFTKIYKGDIATNVVTTAPPAIGPVDQELCYDRFPAWREAFTKQGDVVTAQVAWPQHSLLPSLGPFDVGPFGEWKIPPVFKRPEGIGLRVIDANGQEQLDNSKLVYDKYDSIPTLLVSALGSVEDQGIVKEGRPNTVNHAVNWPRTAKAAYDSVKQKVHLGGRPAGGSTLAQQTARNQGTKNNQTRGAKDKFISQIGMASTWAYRYGADTTQARLEDVTTYINTASFGHHRGFKAAMAHFFGNIGYDDELKNGVHDAKSAKSARELLILVMAVQKPSDVLLKRDGFADANMRLDKLLNVMPLEPQERALIRAAKIDFDEIGKHPAKPPQAEPFKSIESLVLALQKKTGMDQADGRFKLNSCDLTVTTSLDAASSHEMHTNFLSFNDPKVAEANKLVGTQLLRKQEAPYTIKYSATIARVFPERSLALVEVSDDTFGGEHDVNRDGKINPGSRHKRRMLSTISEARAQLYDELKPLTPEERKQLPISPKDQLMHWVVDYMNDPSKDPSLAAMLEASGKITHPNSRRCYFTGEGMLCAHNFDEKYTARATEEEIIAYSYNQGALAMTDDLREHITWHILKTPLDIYNGDSTDATTMAARTKLVDDYTLYEGSVHLSRGFIAMYDTDKKQGKTGKEIGHILAQRSNGSTEALAVLHFSVNNDATYESMVEYMTEECALPRMVPNKNGQLVALPKVACDLSKDNLDKMYDKHAPSRMVDVAGLIAKNIDGTPQALFSVYRTLHPQATYQETRKFLSTQKPDTDPFKDFHKEFNAATPMAPEQLVMLLDRSAAPAVPTKTHFSLPEQLAALHGIMHPNADYKTTQAFIGQHMGEKKPGDYKKLFERYQSGVYDPKALYFNFNLNDRHAMARAKRSYRLNPMWMEMGRMFVENPKISLDEALAQSTDTRLLIGSWIRNLPPKPVVETDAKKLEKQQERALKRRPRKTRTQNRLIYIMLERKAFAKVQEMWKQTGYPFRVVPSLATVIGISGDNTQSLTNYSAILLNHGRTVYTTSFTGISGGTGGDNPHRFHAEPGIPAPVQVLHPETAEHVLNVARGGMELDRGTSHILKGVFKDCDGSDMIGEGKTGTTDDIKSLGVRVAGWTGTFRGKFNNDFALTFDGYKDDADSKDKFTSGLITRVLKAQAHPIQAVMDKACPKPEMLPMPPATPDNPRPIAQFKLAGQLPPGILWLDPKQKPDQFEPAMKLDYPVKAPSLAELTAIPALCDTNKPRGSNLLQCNKPVTH